jgi:hypothetical protein
VSISFTCRVLFGASWCKVHVVYPSGFRRRSWVTSPFSTCFPDTVILTARRRLRHSLPDLVSDLVSLAESTPFADDVKGELEEDSTKLLAQAQGTW